MSTLLAYRHFKNWTEEDVANKLGISVEGYRDLESGQDDADSNLALKLSEIFEAPPHLFFSNAKAQQQITVFSNCNFSGNGASGYVNHMYHNEANDQDQTIASLKNQVRMLREQNENLMEIIRKRFES